MDPDANVQERLAILSGASHKLTRSELERMRELSLAYAEWRSNGGFPAKDASLRRLRRMEQYHIFA